MPARTASSKAGEKVWRRPARSFALLTIDSGEWQGRFGMKLERGEGLA